MRPAGTGQLPTLIPCSADRCGGHLSAALPLSSTQILAGWRPHGLALLQRSLEAERQQHGDAKRLFERELERGRDPGEGAGVDGEEEQEQDPLLNAGRQQQGGQGGKPVFIPGPKQTADLEVLAACAVPHAPSAICPGRLGVTVHDLQHAGGDQATAVQGPASAVVVSTGGAVYHMGMLEEEPFHHLFNLQRTLEQQEQHGPLPGTLGPGLHTSWWGFSPAEGLQENARAAGGNCIDADFVAAALLPLGTLEQASGLLGLPVRAMEQARQALRGPDT